MVFVMSANLGKVTCFLYNLELWENKEVDLFLTFFPSLIGTQAGCTILENLNMTMQEQNTEN